MLREVATLRRRHHRPDPLMLMIRVLGERYEWMPPGLRRRARLRHALAAWLLLPGVWRQVRAELRRRWLRPDGTAGAIVADHLFVAAHAVALLLSITARAMCDPTPCPAVRLRRWWSPAATQA